MWTPSDYRPNPDPNIVYQYRTILGYEYTIYRNGEHEYKKKDATAEQTNSHSSSSRTDNNQAFNKKKYPSHFGKPKNTK